MDLPVLTEALSLMESVPGWFAPEEAVTLAGMTAQALERYPEGEVVELGSWMGRSTVLLARVAREYGHRVVAIDPHEGILVPGDPSWNQHGSTYREFLANVQGAGLRASVRAIRKRATDVRWGRPIALLFVDSIHDRENCTADFLHFEPYLRGYVAFHDYSDDAPGVKEAVDSLTSFRQIARAGSLVVLERA